MLLKIRKIILFIFLIFLIILWGWKIYATWQVKQWQSELYLNLWQIASKGNCENAEINSFFDSERNNGVNFSWWTSENRPARSLLMAFIFSFGPRKDVCGYTDYDQYINMYEKNEKLERKEEQSFVFRNQLILQPLILDCIKKKNIDEYNSRYKKYDYGVISRIITGLLCPYY